MENTKIKVKNQEDVTDYVVSILQHRASKPDESDPDFQFKNIVWDEYQKLRGRMD